MAIAVGVIANPASGRDIRRMVSGASVFDNAEKGRMIYRLLVGLGAVGVERVLLMPAGAGVGDSFQRNLHAHATHPSPTPLPTVEPLAMPLQGNAADTVEATRRMIAAGVAAIVVLGGDGTHRVVAQHCGVTPLCTLSTGTNNAFPQVREATIAGLATGLVATGAVDAATSLRQEKLLEVRIDGATPRRECALVDVAISADPWIGSRALWRIETISEIVVGFAEPGAVGLSAIAALLDPVSRAAPYARYLRLGDPDTAPRTVLVPLAPGLVIPVGVLESREIGPEEPVPLAARFGCLALDGEREVELAAGDRVEAQLRTDGPRTIDVDAVMRAATGARLLETRSPLARGALSPTAPHVELTA